MRINTYIKPFLALNTTSAATKAATTSTATTAATATIDSLSVSPIYNYTTEHSPQKEYPPLAGLPPNADIKLLNTTPAATPTTVGRPRPVLMVRGQTPDFVSEVTPESDLEGTDGFVNQSLDYLNTVLNSWTQRIGNFVECSGQLSDAILDIFNTGRFSYTCISHESDKTVRFKVRLTKD